jgi:hypothetical protein
VVKFIKEHIVFILLLFSCLILRLFPLFDYQFTLDEWSALGRVNFYSFSELIEKGVKIDAHPAFVQVLIYYLTQLFGCTAWIIKLPFLLFSFGALIYAYAFCLRNFSKQSAIISAAIFGFSLVFVFYAPIARMYISGVFFSAGLLYHFFEIFFLKNNKKIHFFLLGFFGLLSALNQHINALFAFTVFASALLFLNKTNLKPYLITCILVIALYLPHLPVTLYQLGIGGIGFEQGGWLPKPEPRSVFSFLKILSGTGSSYLVFISLIILCIIADRQFKFSPKQLYLIVIFFVNFFIIYFYSVFRAPVFQNSVMLFASVAMILAVSPLLDFKNKYFFYFSFSVITSVLIFKTYYKKDYLNQCVKNIFEYQFERTLEYTKNSADVNVNAIFFDVNDLMRDIFLKKYKYKPGFKLANDSVTRSLKNFSSFVSESKGDILVLASSDPQHQAIALDYFPYILEKTVTQSLNYIVLSKKGPAKYTSIDSVLNHSTFRNENGFTYNKPKQAFFTIKGFSLFVDSLNEYPYAANGLLKNISYKEGQVILAEVRIHVPEKKLNGLRLCISFNDIKTDSVYFFNATQSNDYVFDENSNITLYTEAYLGTSYKKIKDKTKVTVYLWNSKKEKFVFDNFEIKTIDYWNKKWNYWE